LSATGNINIYPTVQRGTAKAFTATFTDLPEPFGSGALIDADSHLITIYDGNGLVQNKYTSPTRISVGTYMLWYTPPVSTQSVTSPANLWRLNWQMTKGGIVSEGDQYFIVTT
jgi:hypothetical protein